MRECLRLYLSLGFSYSEAFCLGMELVCDIAIVVGALAYLPLQTEVAFEAGSPSACLGQYAHATTSMRKNILPVGLPLFMTAHAMETCFVLVTVSASD